MGGPGSGGARKNGRPVKKTRQYGTAFKSALQKALKAKAKETGKSLQQVIVDMAYDEQSFQNARLGALKLITDVLVPKESHRTVDQTTTVKAGPLVLPPLKEDPARIDLAAEGVQEGEDLH